jgi:hypothetical protein
MIYWIGKYFTQLDTHLKALAEVAITAFFSLAPFATAILIPSIKRADGTFISLVEVVGRGQVFLLSYGLYGTIFWLAFANGEYPRHTARIMLGTIATLTIIPVVSVSGVDPTFSTVLNPSLIKASYWLYGLFIVINYLLLVYMRIEPPEPREVYKREAKTMLDDYRRMPK